MKPPRLTPASTQKLIHCTLRHWSLYPNTVQSQAPLISLPQRIPVPRAVDISPLTQSRSGIWELDKRDTSLPNTKKEGYTWPADNPLKEFSSRRGDIDIKYTQKKRRPQHQKDKQFQHKWWWKSWILDLRGHY